MGRLEMGAPGAGAGAVVGLRFQEEESTSRSLPRPRPEGTSLGVSSSFFSQLVTTAFSPSLTSKADQYSLSLPMTDLIAPAVCLTDLDNEAGLWFIYQASLFSLPPYRSLLRTSSKLPSLLSFFSRFDQKDIAIRTEGVYSLRFSLFDLDSRTPDSQSHAPILAECFSSPLTIYAPRK